MVTTEIVKDKCPECGTKMEETYEPQIQEYPGAYPQPGHTEWNCPKCGFYGGSVKEKIDTGKIIENTRGW
jgi:uncharacterized protein with PIN domain